MSYNTKLTSILFSLFFSFLPLYSTPIYIVTAASADYYTRLLNFIGSVHHTNFDNLEEITIYDLGLTQNQVKHLQTIQKVTINTVEMTHPDLLKVFITPTGPNFPWSRGKVLGWYAWKPVVIKQALEKFPYVLWIDAGTTVLNSLTDLTEYVQEHGYFICTIGHGKTGNRYNHNTGWGTTQYVARLFNLDKPENSWVLEAETVMAGLIGVAQGSEDKFIIPMCEMTKDLRNYQDDGSAPNGWGTARYEQTLLSIFAYIKNLTIFKQDSTQKTPILLSIKEEQKPFYITWQTRYVDKKTHIYNSRTDLKQYNFYLSKIRYK